MRALFGEIAIVALIIVAIFKIFNVMYEPRCRAIGGEWHAWRGCKMINQRGEVQWVTRP